LVDTVHMTDDELLWQFLIDKARTSAAVLAELIFRDEALRLIRQSQVHLDLHAFFDAHQEGVCELPREHGKTINMLAKAAHVIGHNPDIRMKIVSSTDEIGVARNTALGEVLSHPVYNEVFPHIQRGRSWSDEKFTVKRNVITPEPTCEGFGVMSKGTGGRCDFMWLDDIDDEEVVVSNVKRNRNRERTANVWLNLLAPQGKAFALCTPWHEADTVHMLKNNGWPVFRRPVHDMTPVWPERWGVKQLEERRRKIGSLAFARGYELVCINAETAPIKGQWFKLWRALPRLTNIGIAVDPNNSLRDTADYTAIGLLGVTWDYRVYLLDVIRSHFEFPGLMTAILDMAARAEQRYHMRPFIGVEDTAYQRAIPQQLKVQSKYPIYGLKADKSKFVRASRLAVHIENGRVHLRGAANNAVDPEQAIVYDEAVAFPSSQHVDCVDMLGYGVEMMLQLARMSGAVAV